MADGLYIGMAGAAARAEQLDSIADNLANAQTPGFKPARPAFASFLATSGAADKVYSAAVATGVDVRPGPTTRTGNPLDVLPEGAGLLAVRTAKGDMAFTRAGRLTPDADGLLRAAGLPVLAEQGAPIHLPPQSKAVVGTDGTVTADGQRIARLGVWTIDGPMSRIGPQLLSLGDKSKPAPAEPKLRIGEVELGSYSALEATVQMVGAQRHFDATMQALQTYRRLDDRALEIGRIR